MKYVITGAAGNISGLLVRRLAAAGHQVTVIGRNEDHLQELLQAGVQTAIGSLEDLPFLKQVFRGADAVYTMVPPNPISNDQIGFHEKLGVHYAEAIQHAGIQYVVNLSSIGAHLPKGAGLPSGLFRVERILNSLPIAVKHLRAGYSYQNLFANIGLINNMGIMGSNFSADDNDLPIASAADIATAAAEELLTLDFTGHTVRYVVSDETGTDQIAGTIGKAIGKEDLRWTRLADEQVLFGLLQFGFSKDAADHIVQTGSAIDKGILMEDYYLNRPATLGTIRLSDFAQVFAHVYQSAQ
jgi:uncharacterized protein YbjT (DUF2867 family)